MSGHENLRITCNRDKIPTNDTYKRWAIVNNKGDVISVLYGPSAALVALAACERLKDNYNYYGWFNRLSAHILENKDETESPS